MTVSWKPDFLAEFALLSSEEGGRHGPTPSEWFGCPLGFEGEYFDVRFDLENVGSVKPGGTAVAPGKFLSPQLIKHRLVVGSQFTLWEGRIIGTGKVLDIYAKPGATHE